MADVLNLAEKYSPLIDERFKLKSITDAYAGKQYEFDGVRSIKVYSVNKVKLGKYDRTKSSFRFGEVKELGDTLQVLPMEDEPAFTFSVDAGNASDQMYIKQANMRIKANWDEECVPYIDMYRFNKWTAGAGISSASATDLTKDNIIERLMLANAAMSNRFVPRANRAIFIAESEYVKCKLSSQLMAIWPIGQKALANGEVGKLDGCAVIPVPDSYLPDGVRFICKWKNASADPMKLKTLRIQKHPLGFDGDVGECRFYQDAFVLANKADGIFVDGDSDVICAEPTFSESGGSLTITSTTSTAKIIYTVDGSNPKAAGSVTEEYSDAFSVSGLASGDVVRAYTEKSGLIPSGISEWVKP